MPDQLALPQFAVANAHFVTPRLVIGGDLDYWDHEHADRQLSELAGAGVTHIVDARCEATSEDFVARFTPQIAYLHHGMDDAGQVVPGEWFDIGVRFALDALTDPAAVVLTHCHMGINRGPSLGFAVLLALGWDPVEALDAIRKARPIAAIAYAEDALRWRQDRTGVPIADRRQDQDRLAQWRIDNDLDVETVIRVIRETEEP
jgi:dual specificity phosphatase 3